MGYFYLSFLLSSCGLSAVGPTTLCCAGVDGALLQCGSGRDLVPRCQLFSSFNLTSLTPTPPTPTHTPQRQPAPHHLGATSGLWDEAWSAWWPADSAHVHVVDVPQHDTSTSVSLRRHNVVPPFSHPIHTARPDATKAVSSRRVGRQWRRSRVGRGGRLPPPQ